MSGGSVNGGRAGAPAVLAPAVLALALLGAGGCSLITEFPDNLLSEKTEPRCSDELDNDGNGLTDCADPSCSTFDFCREDSAGRCSDALDNDKDGKIDCADADCCQTDQCTRVPICQERTKTACTDGRDNDQDGLTDCADFSCSGSYCCNDLVPVLQDTFATTSAGCTPPDCGSMGSLCCDKALVGCNTFDSQRWVAWGTPRPRIVNGAFTPNQPCPLCPASGVISVAEVNLAPGLLLEFVANSQGDSSGLLSVGLVDQVVIPQTDRACGGVASLFPMRVGISVRGATVEAIVQGTVRGQATGKDQGDRPLSLRVEEDGTLTFRLGNRPEETSESLVKVTGVGTRMRVMIQGKTAKGTVDNLVVGQLRGCRKLDSWANGATGPGPVFSPSPDEKVWDHSSVGSPSILLEGDLYYLFYTGTTSKVAGSFIGLATSGDGQNWTRATQPLTIVKETGGWVSDPVVIRDPQRGFIMAYRSKSVGQLAEIAIASSPALAVWTRELMAIKAGGGQAWDGADVLSPALVRFVPREGAKEQLYVYYVGKGAGTQVPALGLAIAGESSEKLKFTRHGGNPVLVGGAGSQDDLGVTDPWVLYEDGSFKLWYVGLGWGGKSQINYAASDDGKRWVRYPGNPVLKNKAFGYLRARSPTVLDRWGLQQMWYGASDPSGLPSIGHALNPVVAQ
jgi:predicted GH43/DUF377 family glycosyl hydrolase